MLDPTQRNLSVVQEYLSDRGISSVQFLNQMITKYACEENLTTANTETNETSSSISEQSNWKRARLKLISKHAANNVSNTEREL